MYICVYALPYQFWLKWSEAVSKICDVRYSACMVMSGLSLSTIVLLGLILTVEADAALSRAMAIPSQCPHSGVLRLKAGEYTANVSLGNCTIIGEAPAVVIHGKVAFDHGLLMGIIHFEGGGATSSCVEGSVVSRVSLRWLVVEKYYE